MGFDGDGGVWQLGRPAKEPPDRRRGCRRSRDPQLSCRHIVGGYYVARRFSMRRSGISQISAAITKIAWAIHEERRLATIATTYSTSDSLPFQSRPIAFLKSESCPCERIIACWSTKYAVAAMSSTTPYS